VLYFDKEGNRTDTAGSPGKMKAMGLDLKRSDTPVFVQDFLSELLMMVLTNGTEKDVLARISQFRAEFKARPGWEKGSPKRANNVANYLVKENKEGRANMPGHVRASINWNRCREMYGDKYSMPITDGAKVIVCKLKNNPWATPLLHILWMNCVFHNGFKSCRLILKPWKPLLWIKR
jgi:hypothetical protein